MPNESDESDENRQNDVSTTANEVIYTPEMQTQHRDYDLGSKIFPRPSSAMSFHEIQEVIGDIIQNN